MRLRYRARFYEEDGGWLAEVPEVGGGGLMTQGDTLEELRRMASDAVTQVLLSRVDTGEAPDAPSKKALPKGWEWVTPDIRVETALLIRQMRKDRGMSMQQVADAVRVSLSSYQRWEDPERCNATVQTLEKLARAFGCHVEVAFV